MDAAFRKAYYIKLGRGGKWERQSIAEGSIRFGWTNQTIEDINCRRWEKIKQQLAVEHDGKPGVATRDYNDLRRIVESTAEDLWITFHDSKLWWGRAGEPVIYQDETSKYRLQSVGWSDTDMTGQPLLVNRVPGELTQIQRYQGTLCEVHAVEELRRVIGGQASEISMEIRVAKEALIDKVALALKQLHWKDFETLVDLVFRNAGWRRISVVGESMKFADIELEEPVTGELYQVQVKSAASLADYERYASEFSEGPFRKLYFVVHSPEGDLSVYPCRQENIELVLPRRLATMVVDFGLVDWLVKKVW